MLITLYVKKTLRILTSGKLDFANSTLTRLLSTNFRRHPKVSDEFGNPAVGIGYGMARTTDNLTLAYYFLRYVGLPRKNTGYILDLGSGDGWVLHLLSVLRYRNLLGIEFDSELVSLSIKNVPRAIFIEGDFTSLSVTNKLGNLHKEIRAIYIFNPAHPEDVVDFLYNIENRNEIILVMKNPKALGHIMTSTHFSIELLRYKSNYAVLILKKLV